MPVGAVIFVVVWVGMALGFGLWMLFWPNHYWETWREYLKGGDPFEGVRPGRTEYLRAYVNRPNANRRARVLGALFVLAGLGVAGVFAFGRLPTG